MVSAIDCHMRGNGQSKKGKCSGYDFSICDFRIFITNIYVTSTYAIWSHILKKSLQENFISCVMYRIPEYATNPSYNYYCFCVCVCVRACVRACVCLYSFIIKPSSVCNNVCDILEGTDQQSYEYYSRCFC